MRDYTGYNRSNRLDAYRLSRVVSRPFAPQPRGWPMGGALERLPASNWSDSRLIARPPRSAARSISITGLRWFRSNVRAMPTEI